MKNDYISREAVVRYLKGYSEKECNSSSPYGMITSSVLNKAERALSEMPAADVQPVKRGKWLHFNNENFIFCSECEHEAYRDNDDNQHLFDFCPYCGAKMI